MDEDNIVMDLEKSLQLLKRSIFTNQEGPIWKKAESHILWMIAAQKDQLIMPSEIAKKSGVTMAAITHHINSLEEQGLVERTLSPEDRRIMYVSLTEKGRLEAGKVKKEHQEKLQDFVTFLGEKDSAEMIKLLNKIAQYIQIKKENK